MYIGRALFSLPLGYLADIKGRKFMLLVLSSLLAIFTIMFGFSYNYEWTIIARFFQGCTMGMVAISKSLIVEYCDDTNTALGMAILIASFSCGMILGPCIGAYLAFPCDLYPSVFSKDSIFGKFVILLPCLFFSFALIICIIISIICLPSDKKVTKLKEENEILLETSGCSQETTDENFNSVELKPKANNEDKHSTSKLGSFHNSNLVKLVRLKSFLITCIVYELTCFNAVAFDEMFPVYAATSKLYNGYGFSTVAIGESLLVVTIIILILEFTFIPKVLSAIGARKIFIVAELVQVVLYPFLPLIQSLNDRTIFWIALLVILFLVRLSIAVSFLGSTLILNNTLDKKLLGLGNGLGITFGTTGRIISPLVFGSLFTWSLQNVKRSMKDNNALGFPFNQYFIFILLSTFSLVASVIVIFLPKKLDNPRKKRKIINEKHYLLFI